MKASKLSLFIMFFALFLTGNVCKVLSVPAKSGSFIMKQPDGTVLTLTVLGDECYCYYLTQDGYPLLPEKDGKLCYAYLNDGKLKTSTFLAHEVGERSSDELKFLASIDKGVVLEKIQVVNTETRKKVFSAPKKLPSGSMLMREYPTIGSPKELVLLIQFSDVKFSGENPWGAFNSLVNQEGYSYNGATGSVKDYYRDNSGGLFTPQFDVFGPITLPKTEAYYGAPAEGRIDNAPWEMVIDACNLIDGEIDFSQYDNNNDGYVDNIFVFYAGYGQNEGASPNTIWPHSNDIEKYGNAPKLDGVIISNYACTNELKGIEGTVRCGIGTFCHEYGHVLGLPDLYETNRMGASFTPGKFEVMDVGPYNNNGNTPPYMSSFDRLSVGWLNPVELNAPVDVALKDISYNEAYIINTIEDNEFFLFENRQHKGWDTYIPGHGMLVWHIDFNKDVWLKNSVNNNPTHQYVDLVEADNIRSSNSILGDLFPGSKNVTQFTDDSTPKMVTWKGFPVGKPITNIKEQDEIIMFKVMGGGERPSKVDVLDATDIKATSFTANWKVNTGIYDYEIDICKQGTVIPMETKSTGDVTSYTFTGLTPLTSYYYKVRAVDGLLKSEDSKPVSVTTAEPTFDLLAVSVLAATDIADDAFTANWKAMDNAQSYLLNVYWKEIGEPVYSVADFTGSIAGLPEGWDTDCTMTYSLSGYFGKEKPALRMGDNTYLTSPVFDEDIRNLSFWYRGNKVSEENTLKIEGYKNSQWDQIEVLANLTNEQGGFTYTIGEGYNKTLEGGYRAIRITYRSIDDNPVAIDDVKVGYGGVRNNILIDGYDERNVGNVTSFRVNGLEKGRNYYYTVKATDGTLFSIISNEIDVHGSTSIIDAPQWDNICIREEGKSLIIENTGGRVEDIKIYNSIGQMIRKVKSVPGTTVIRLADKNIYLISFDGRTQKVIL